MWKPDGWGWRARIGVLTPHFDVGPESEFQAMAPEGVSIHAARVPLGIVDGSLAGFTMTADPVRAFADPPNIDEAAAMLAASPLHVIALAFTSSSYLRGAADDAAVKARLEERTRGLPVVITCAAAVLALRALGATRLSMVNPPWFPADVIEKGAEYFRSQGIEVVQAVAAGLPPDQQAIHPGQLYAWARAHISPRAEVVFVGGNGFRAVGAIHALEEDLGRPVLTANSVTLWHALRLAGVRAPVTDYGRLFERELPTG